VPPEGHAWVGEPVLQRCNSTCQQSVHLEHARTCRFWHDEKRFKGTGEDSLAQIALLSIGGARVGGHVKSAPTQGPLGWEVSNHHV
jgi:hypothetical protein